MGPCGLWGDLGPPSESWGLCLLIPKYSTGPAVRLPQIEAFCKSPLREVPSPCTPTPDPALLSTPTCLFTLFLHRLEEQEEEGQAVVFQDSSAADVDVCHTEVDADYEGEEVLRWGSQFLVVSGAGSPGRTAYETSATYVESLWCA